VSLKSALAEEGIEVGWYFGASAVVFKAAAYARGRGVLNIVSCVMGSLCRSAFVNAAGLNRRSIAWSQILTMADPLSVWSSMAQGEVSRRHQRIREESWSDAQHVCCCDASKPSHAHIVAQLANASRWQQHSQHHVYLH